MIGYIYVTKTTCCHYYIGQHKRQKFDESYLGSGNQLPELCRYRHYMDKYGIRCLNMNDYSDTNIGCVFVHKKTNVIAIGTKEMGHLYRITHKKILRIFKGEIDSVNGLFPEDWEMMTYKEYDVRCLII